MALLESCCCWRSVRRGSYASAIYTMVYFALTTLVVGCFLYDEQVVMTTTNSTRSGGTTASLLQPDSVSEATVAFNVAVLVCSTCGLFSTWLLIVGLRLDNRLLLIPWMFSVALTAVIDITHILYYLATCEANFKPEVAMLFTVVFFLLSLNLYALLCVVSQYQEYKAGRGRAVDEDRLLRFAPVRYLAQPTATSGLSTRRGTHTTVHDAHSPSGGDARDARDARDVALLPSAGPGLQDGVYGAHAAHAANGALSMPVVVQRLTVPPPPYSRRQGAAATSTPSSSSASQGGGGARKHVKFPDMCNSGGIVVLDEDSSLLDSPSAGRSEDGSTGLHSEWPLDEKALLSPV